MILGGRYWRYSRRLAPAPSPLSLMSGFKICSDGELLPRYIPCPPPFTPFPYYPPAPPFISDPDRSQISLSTGAIAGIVILLGFVFVLAGLFILKCAGRSADSPSVSRHELQATGLSRTAADSAASGLEDILVKLLPVCPYRPNKLDDSSGECAVCLSCFEEEEFVRILPRCQHTFHLRCIDKWFESHANCPLCREKITLQIIQAPDEPPQQSSEAVAVSLSDEGNERDVEEEGQNSAEQAQDDGEANGTGDCERLRESESADVWKGDAARSTPGGIRSFPGPRCEDCRSKQAASGLLKSVRTEEIWSSTTMAAWGILRRSHSTGSMKLDRSWADRHSQLSFPQDPCCSRPVHIHLNRLFV